MIKCTFIRAGHTQEVRKMLYHIAYSLDVRESAQKIDISLWNIKKYKKTLTNKHIDVTHMNW